MALAVEGKKDESDTNPTRGKLVPWRNKKAKLI